MLAVEPVTRQDLCEALGYLHETLRRRDAAGLPVDRIRAQIDEYFSQLAFLVDVDSLPEVVFRG